MNPAPHPPVLFLDVDGVLNRCGKSSQGLEHEQVALLKWILSTVPCRVVISSTWRKYPHQLRRLVEVLLDMNAKLVGCTPILESKTEGGLITAKSRGEEIQRWIDMHDTPARFVILDDGTDMGHLLPHLVKTDSYTGLTPEIAAEVIRRLNVQTPLR